MFWRKTIHLKPLQEISHRWVQKIFPLSISFSPAFLVRHSPPPGKGWDFKIPEGRPSLMFSEFWQKKAHTVLF